MVQLKHLLPVIMLCVMATGCNRKQQKESTESHSVMVVTPERSVGAQAKNFSGVVKEAQSISLGFRTPGQISRILVKEGDRVKKGQLIATLDDKDYQLAADAAKTQYYQVQGEVRRLQTVYESNALSANDYEKASSGLEQARINMQAKQNQLSYTKLFAPVSGVVQHVNFEVAEQVGAGMAVVDLLNVQQMEVEISVPSDVYKLRDRFDGAYAVSGGQRIALHPSSVQPKADANQLFTLKFFIEGHFSAGESLDVYLDIKADTLSSNELTLPVHAISEYKGKKCVFVVDEKNIAHRREVTVGTVDKSGRVIIISGIQPTDRVVKAGATVLTDGEKVNVVGKSDKTNVGGLL